VPTELVGHWSGKTRQLHALFNNNYEDKAVSNAAQMKLMLD
jgi:uncharacterized protein YecE (DUF72 family)